MITFTLIGTGWRAAFFVRVAKALPHLFFISGVWNHREESGVAFCKEHNLPWQPSLNALLGTQCDFVVNCCAWQAAAQTNLLLLREGIPTLTETPPALEEEDLAALWALAQEKNACFEVAEQYFLQPYLQAAQAIVDSGALGKVSDVTLSMMHGYHAVSVLRRLLGVGMQGCTISAQSFAFSVCPTGGRAGIVRTSEPKQAEKTIALISFDGGARALYSFSPEQYFSSIRSWDMVVCGERGEINQLAVRRLNARGEPVCEAMHRVDTGAYGNNEGYSLRGIQWNGDWVYQNPFAEKTIADGFRLTDEELAIAEALCRMHRSTQGGAPHYLLREALQDTWISQLINRAAQTGQPQCAQAPLWA